MKNLLLLFMPLTALLEHFLPQSHLLIFAASAIAILPLAGWMSQATEQLAEHMGPGVGGLLSATFGNAAELIIALTALHAGLYDVVKASIAGSIVGNILLVLGASMLAGGLKYKEQHFNVLGARSQATMMTLAAIALIIPAAYRSTAGDHPSGNLVALSTWISCLLLIVYALNLLFTLKTHASFLTAENNNAHSGEYAEASTLWSKPRATTVLAAATLGVVWMSEILVGAITPAAQALGLSDIFVGVFLIAILGSAAEQAMAVSAAMKNKMDLSFSIAIGSSVQVALFVAPMLVLLSHFVGPTPMDLAFRGGLVLSILLAVLITGQIAGDGRSDWLKGVQLLAVYMILGMAFFFVPST